LNKNIDSVYFGTFFKDGDNYVLSNKTVNEFSKKNTDATAAADGGNLENLDSVSINFQVIANVIGTTSETIHAFFNQIRDSIKQLCTTENHKVSLNLGVGQLSFYQN
jgi:hypothetical protein